MAQKITRSHLNQMNRLMVKARQTRSREDMLTMYRYYRDLVSVYGEESIYMNFHNLELVILEEAEKMLSR